MDAGAMNDCPFDSQYLTVRERERDKEKEREAGAWCAIGEEARAGGEVRRRSVSR